VVNGVPDPVKNPPLLLVNWVVGRWSKLYMKVVRRDRFAGLSETMSIS
jgi:hypothetical protein